MDVHEGCDRFGLLRICLDVPAQLLDVVNDGVKFRVWSQECTIEVVARE